MKCIQADNRYNFNFVIGSKIDSSREIICKGTKTFSETEAVSWQLIIFYKITFWHMDYNSHFVVPTQEKLLQLGYNTSQLCIMGIVRFIKIDAELVCFRSATLTWLLTSKIFPRACH